MLEKDGVLWTWEWLQLIIDECHPIRRLFDHRLAYLTYEGPLSQHRGSVNQIAAGRYLGRCEGDGIDAVLSLERSPAGWPPRCRLVLTPVANDRWSGLLQTITHDVPTAT